MLPAASSSGFARQTRTDEVLVERFGWHAPIRAAPPMPHST